MRIDFEQVSQNIKSRVYRYIGAGSGRTVFDLGNGCVVKMARNRKGIAQNEAEYKIAHMDNTGIFARVHQVSPDFSMLIMEKAERVHDISSVWQYFNVRNNKELFRLNILSSISSKYHLLQADLSRPQNWGMIGSKAVIIDYGFTRRVRNRYYSFF